MKDFIESNIEACVVVFACVLIAAFIITLEVIDNANDSKWRESGYVWTPRQETPAHWEKSK